MAWPRVLVAGAAPGGAAGAARLIGWRGAAGRHEGEPSPGRQREGGQKAERGLGAAAGAVGCEGRVGPGCAAGADCGAGQRSAQQTQSEAAAGHAVRAAAVGAGWVPAGCGYGELLGPVAGWGSGRQRGSPVEGLQRPRPGAQAWGAGRLPGRRWKGLEQLHWGPAGLGAAPAASAAGRRSPSHSRCPVGWGCWGTCCDCPGQCLWGHCCPHR